MTADRQRAADAAYPAHRWGRPSAPAQPRWVFERSSGYPGYRCQSCATWVYENQARVCACTAASQPSPAAR